MNLIARASHEEKWGVDLADYIQIWRAGFIIESEYIANLLQPVYKKEQGTTNILLAKSVRDQKVYASVEKGGSKGTRMGCSHVNTYPSLSSLLWFG